MLLLRFFLKNHRGKNGWKGEKPNTPDACSSREAPAHIRTWGLSPPKKRQQKRGRAPKIAARRDSGWVVGWAQCPVCPLIKWLLGSSVVVGWRRWEGGRKEGTPFQTSGGGKRETSDTKIQQWLAVSKKFVSSPYLENWIDFWLTVQGIGVIIDGKSYTEWPSQSRRKKKKEAKGAFPPATSE